MSAILFWNAVALEANRISHTFQPKEQAGPVLSARALAIVHLAMYDAHVSVAGYTKGPYQNGLPPAPAGIAAASAVAGAAATALLALFPSQSERIEAKLAEFGGRQPGFDHGAEIARRLLEARRGDPGAGDANYGPSPLPGHHRIDPDNPDQGFYAPFYGQRTRLFATTKRLSLEAPPFQESNGDFSQDYLEALRELRGKGIAPELMGTLPGSFTARTAEETLIGIYWGYDGAAGLGTPPRLYNQIVRRLAIAKGSPEGDLARLFALVNVALADAGILCWADKYKYDFWRPVVAIREHDPSLGPGAPKAKNDLLDDADPGWLPLGAPATNSLVTTFEVTSDGPFPGNQAAHGRTKNFTPNFPAYPSGHATFGAAALHAARLFYGVKPGDYRRDDLFDGLDFVSEELDGENQDNRGTVRPRHRRSFPGGLWQMIVENGRSRIFLGVHWIFDAFATRSGKPDLGRNVGGVRLGVDIAENLAAHGLKQSQGAAP